MPLCRTRLGSLAGPGVDPDVVSAISSGMASDSGSDTVMAALRERRSAVRRVAYRQNRTVLLSVSRDGRTLNSHECFRDAPPAIAQAIATFVASPRRSLEYRRALEAIRGWEGSARGLEQARRSRRRRSARTGGAEAEPLRALFDRYNRERFGGWLPGIPLRVSRRMTRALGTIAYSDAGGPRAVREIAISADLLLPANQAVLADTILHEMAHAEAWLRHGHQGHGPVWRRIAARVGCTPRALTRTPVRGRHY